MPLMRLTPPNRSQSSSDQISTEHFLSPKVVGVVPRDQNGIELLLTTMQAKPRTGVSLAVTDLAAFSGDNDGRYSTHPAFHDVAKPIRLKQIGGEEAVSATKPQVFGLLRQSPEGLWSIAHHIGDGNMTWLPVPAGVWRVDLLVEWTNLSRPERFHFEVTENGRPRLTRDPSERS